MQPAYDRESDVWPYCKGAALNYERLRAWANRKPTLSASLCGLFTQPIKRQLVCSSVATRKEKDQLEALIRKMLSFCIQARSYGYFYFNTMLAYLLKKEQKRKDGYTKRQLRRLMRLLCESDLIVFQLDAMRKGGLYRIAFYDAGNLNKQENQVALYAETLRENLSISHTCLKMRSHACKAKALGIEANRELDLAKARCEAHKAKDQARRREQEAQRRKRLAAATPSASKPVALPPRSVQAASRALTPVSIPKLVTATLQAPERKVRRVDRSGGALGHYRDKLVAMGLTRAVQEYDRLQMARDLR